MQGRVAWHKLLTARLVGKIKLVGPVVSCEGTPFMFIDKLSQVLHQISGRC